MNLETLHRYHEDGLLYNQTHPTLPLTIWNYTEKVQYEGLWDEVTLQCRGLVTDDNGNIVAIPFKKFFNIEEGKHTPTSEFEVYEKMDGSLGIMFHYRGEWHYASRGSFTSDQAIKFKEIFESKYKTSHLTITNTYLFEIIYPENRIVVDYNGMEDVIMLGEIHNVSGEELDLKYWENSIFNVVKKYDGVKDYTTLKGMVEDNHEGFVVRFSNGDRMKVKGEEYVRLHKIMTNLSTTAVWEVLSNGGSMDELLKDVPDEFYEKIKEYETELRFSFDTIKREYEWIFNKIKNVYFDVYEKEFSRAEFAMLAKRYKYPSILFALLDGKDISPIIWKIVKPEFKKL
jgi:RNA ligase